MSCNVNDSPNWEDAGFWEAFQHLEARHQQIDGLHEAARRELETALNGDAESLRKAWDAYRKILDELNCSADELADMKVGPTAAEVGAAVVEGS